MKDLNVFPRQILAAARVLGILPVLSRPLRWMSLSSLSHQACKPLRLHPADLLKTLLLSKGSGINMPRYRLCLRLSAS